MINFILDLTVRKNLIFSEGMLVSVVWLRSLLLLGSNQGPSD